MSDTEKVKLIVLVPRELKEALDAKAKEEDRPVASVVRRLLTKAVQECPPVFVPTYDEAGAEAKRQLEAFTAAAAGVHPISRGPVPVGGQDAAAGKGVEERQDEPEFDPNRPPSAPRTRTQALRDAVEGAIRDVADDLPTRLDKVEIGGPNCTHPARFVLGRRCEAPGCGKVIK